MDFVKKVSPDKLKEMQGKSGEGQEIHSEVAIGGESAKNAEGGEGKGMSAEDIDNEIKKLIKIEEVEKKEKDKLEDLKKDSEDKDKKEYPCPCPLARKLIAPYLLMRSVLV